MREWKQRVWNGAAGILLAGTTTVGAATFPYSNDFSSTGLTNATGEFTLDTGNGVLNYAAGGGVVLSTASEPLTDIGTSDFIVSSRFTLNQSDGTSSFTASMGFGAFGSAGDFTGTYYLADWLITPANSGAGRVRILAQGDSSGFLAVNGDSDGAGDNGSSIVAGNIYELRLSGIYTGAPGSEALDMTIALFDDAGNPLGTAGTATDASPLAGQFFGYRNRTANTSHVVDVDYDNFSVGVIPEPTFMATLAAAGSVVLLRRGRRTEPRALAQE